MTLAGLTAGELSLSGSASAQHKGPQSGQQKSQQIAQPAGPSKTRMIGRSVQGRPITAYRIGDPEAATKVVVLATMHGNEAGPARVVTHLISGPAVHGADIWLVPTYNPDGRARHTRQNAHGVDLNRNFPQKWQRLTGSYYSGPAPGSEPETRAIMAFLNNVSPDYVVSFHQPLRGVGAAGRQGRAFVKRLHRGLHLPVKAFNCSSRCHGTMTEWYNAHHAGIAVTVEYGRGLSPRQARRSGPSGVLRAVGAWR